MGSSIKREGRAQRGLAFCRRNSAAGLSGNENESVFSSSCSLRRMAVVFYCGVVTTKSSARVKWTTV
ncbi:MAG: hypothetical protein WCF17_08595, partial [Terracidiphilus sp.]